MTAPEHPGGPYFSELGDHLGAAYLRYSFTKGTQQEIGFLLELMALKAGDRVLDVGCGPGRHAVALAQSGLAVTGVDVSQRFLDVAAQHARDANVPAAFFKVDARQMPFEDEFDAVISICQGGFGLMGDDDSLVLKRMAEAVKPGGLVIVTAFSSYFELTHPREATFDADKGIVHEHTSIKNEAGEDKDVDMWTGVYTPRELRLLALGVGLLPVAVWSVDPGDFARREPDTEHHEFLLVGKRPPAAR